MYLCIYVLLKLCMSGSRRCFLLLCVRIVAFLIPAPDIQPNLRPAFYWQTRMPTLLISRPITAHILPEHCITLDRLKRNPLSLLLTEISLPLALNKSTPTLITRSCKSRKPGPAARAICVEPHHKTANSSSVSSSGTPVVVVAVVPAWSVSLSPQPLNKDVWPPALERACALFNALDDVVA